MTAQILLLLRLAAAGSLYLFFGTALYLIWRDLRYQSRLSMDAPTPGLELVFDHFDGTTRRVRFNESEIVLGRDPACDCVMDQPTVSAQHARLAYRQNHWWLEDLHSTNGTYLNNEAVLSPIVIAHQDLINCGQVQLRVILEHQPGTNLA